MICRLLSFLTEIAVARGEYNLDCRYLQMCMRSLSMSVRLFLFVNVFVCSVNIIVLTNIDQLPSVLLKVLISSFFLA